MITTDVSPFDGSTVDVSGVLDLVRQRADDGERAGRVDADVVAALRATGLNRLLLPRELGGLDASPRHCVEVIERIAAADGSTAWAASIGVGTNHFAGYVERTAAAEIFRDPDATNASMFAALGRATRAADGSSRLTGSWPFTSNCLHASWIGLGATFEDGPDGVADPIPRLAFVPAPVVEVQPTWDVNGMRATGSHTTSVDGVTIARAHSCSFGDQPWPDGTLWRLPLFGVLTPCLAAVFLGIARGALDELSRQARERKARMRPALVDEPVDITDLATADGWLRAARAGLLELLDGCWSLAEAGAPVDRVLQARTLLAAHHVVAVAVDVTSTAHRLGGGQAAYNDSLLLRALRDVQTARQHMLFARGLAARLGPAAAGIEVVVPPFVL